jgi:luciferase family oxidoreductase group 1
MDFDLSVLDLSPVSSGSTGRDALENTLDLAKHADRLGYKRYWLAEHHNLPPVASSAPEVMIEAVANATGNIRVGSGGIMLPNHSALKVAETFRVLEALHPDRIDLGIGRAPGTDPRTAYALRRAPGEDGSFHSADRFPEQLGELFAFAGDGFPEGHPFATISAAPNDVSLPPVWLLGSSDYSAQAAAEVGTGFAFASHFSPMEPSKVMRFYRENFKPSNRLSEPHAILATSVICAETDERALELASSQELSWLRMQKGNPQPLASVEEAMSHPYTPMERERIEAYRRTQITGSPSTVREKVSALVEATGADEVMVTTMVYDHEERLASYERLAGAFRLARAA